MKKLIIGLCAALCATVGRADWTYDSSAGTLTDEDGWVMTVTSYEDRANGVRALSIKKKTNAPASVDLDLSKPVVWTGGTAEIKVLDREFASGSSSLRSVKLPDDLERIIYRAFYNCSSLTNVTPFLPHGVFEIGGDIFMGCHNLKGDLVIGADGQDILDFHDRENPFSGCWAIDSITFGTGTINMGKNCFNGCGAALTITFLGDKTTWRSDSFYDMGTSRGLYKVIRVPDDDHWNAWIEENVVALNESELATYYTQRGQDAPTPAGKTKTDIFKTTQQGWQFVVRMPSAGVKVGVSVIGSPYNLSTVSPTYGYRQYADGSNVTFSVVATNDVYDGRYYVCSGYSLADQGETPVEHPGETSVVIRVTGADKELVWKWADIGAAISAPSEIRRGSDVIGSVALSEAGRLSANCYAYGSTVTLTATAVNSDEPFVRWYGASVPAGHETDNPIEVTVTGPTDIYPYFASKWDVADGKMFDGYWKFKASVSGDEVTASSGAGGQWEQMWDGGLLDLAKPFVNPDLKLVEIAREFLYYGTSYLKNLTLPNTLRTIGFHAFDTCRELQSVNPAFPESLVTIGNAFNRCEKLDIACAQLGGLSTNEIDITELKLNDGPLVRKVVFGCGVKRFGASLFNDYNYLREIYFMGDCPSTFGQSFDGNYPTAYIKKIYIPRRNPTWDAFLANVVPWKDVPEDGKNAYYGEYGQDAPEPLGAGKLGNSKYQCIFLWKSPAEKPTGMMISIY